jgi:NO-binding membrane sensor protein with MHYT domain
MRMTASAGANVLPADRIALLERKLGRSRLRVLQPQIVRDSISAMSISSRQGSRELATVSALLLGLVVSVAVVVGAYALHNPNHIEFAPWPVVSELVAAGVAASLAFGVQAQRRRVRFGLFAFDVGAALVALLMLGAVAFVLSFNQL